MPPAPASPLAAVLTGAGMLGAGLLGAGLLGACGVEYRPGKSGEDSARAVAARDAAAPAAPRVDTVVRTVVRVDTVRVRDTLPALGEVPPDTAVTAPSPVPPSGAAPAAAASRDTAGPTVTAADLAELRARGLRVPVQGVRAADVPDTFGERRDAGSRPHEALDILAPRGTPVLSAADGRVVKLFDSRAGGRTVYVADPAGRWIYYYAHLDAYRPGLAEGQAVRAGEALGTVGSTGNANPAAPHLHFAVARVADVRRWWDGKAVDPRPFLR